MPKPSSQTAITAQLLQGDGSPFANMHLVAMQGVEAMSRLFEFHLTLYFDGPTLPKDVPGTPALLRLSHDASRVRHVHGIIAAFRYCEALTHNSGTRVHVYEATLVPSVWQLLHRLDCRVFYKKSLDKIVDEVLYNGGKGPLGAADYRVAYDKTDPSLGWAGGPRDEPGFRVQYRESDFAFLSRLLEEAGVYYYFTHSDKGHVLVLGNDVAEYGGATPATLPFRDGGSPAVTYFALGEQLGPEGVTLRDFNEARPTLGLTFKTGKAKALRSVYDYPGGYAADAQGKALPKVRLQEAKTMQTVAQGQSDCATLLPGHTFSLDGCAHNAELEGEYLLTRVEHHAHVSGDALNNYSKDELRYQNSFTALPKAVRYRPLQVTPRPSVRGVQTALVVGESSSAKEGTPHLDASGRVKIRFHWDRDGSQCCWVRVSQRIGQNDKSPQKRGDMWFPRVGDEVLVEFVEGDPDRPLVTGSVYTTSDKSGVVYTPHGATDKGSIGLLQPDSDVKKAVKAKTLSVDNTYRNSHKDAANEITLVDDGSGRALMLQSRQASKKDGNLLTDADLHHARSESFYQQVGDAFRQHVGAGGATRATSGAESLYVKKDRTVSVDGDHSESVEGKQTITVGKDQTETVKGDQTLTVEGSQTVTVKKKTTTFWRGGKDEAYADAQAKFTLTLGATAGIFVGGKLDITCGLKVIGTLLGGVTFKFGALDLNLKGVLFDISIGRSAVKYNSDEGVKVDNKKISAKKGAARLAKIELELKEHGVKLRKAQAKLGDHQVTLDRVNLFLLP